jgi:rhamnosyltransferase
MSELNRSVLIMMASYNGETFIGNQIESIINQDFKNWTLIIQDDGSKDRTTDIIKKYCQQDDRITLYHNDTSYHGPFINFHLLANKCKKMQRYDYYMFSDQDDLWDPDKISKFIIFTQKKETDNEPLLTYADMRIIDADDNITCESIDSLYNNGYLNKYAVFFTHKIFGCNLLMNQACFFSVPEIDISNPITKNLSHDNLYAKFAATLGKVVYYPTCLMGYRRYGGNVTSERVYKPGVIRVIQRAVSLKKLAEDHAYIYRISLYTIKLLQDKKLTCSQNIFVESIKKIICEGGFQTISYFRKHRINLGKGIENISHILILVLKMQKKYL